VLPTIDRDHIISLKALSWCVLSIMSNERVWRYPVSAEKEPVTETKTVCYHCGLDCGEGAVAIEDKQFCCNGCKSVYEILGESGLGSYYRSSDYPGAKPNHDELDSRFVFLDDPTVVRTLPDYTDGKFSRLRLHIPQIHCSSCIWLLENLFRLRPGISASHVNFPKRELSVVIENEETSLRQLVELLTQIGYEPRLQLDEPDSKRTPDINRSLHIKVGIAAFCFANIMLFSFPEYLASGGISEALLTRLFRYASIGLALPVLLYSASGYFRSACAGLRARALNIDVPIALGMTVLFTRSLYEIIAGSGSGYLDSFTGLTLFLLLGRLFQQKTYDHLSFDRDYKSYFPLSVIRRTSDGESTVPLAALGIGDRIVVRNREIVPADSVLVDGPANIDYSFVTGESEPRSAAPGEVVFAGGRLSGFAIELKVIKKVSQSYLTSLWNDCIFRTPEKPRIDVLTDSVARYFTIAILSVAAAAAAYWMINDASVVVNAVTAVLIVACPCALALSSPFVLGTAMRILGKNHIYMKNTAAIASLATIDTIVFDKTGTLSLPGNDPVSFEGKPLTTYERKLVAALARHSTHPASRRLYCENDDTGNNRISEFVEIAGKGVEARIDGHLVRLGKPDWVNENDSANGDNKQQPIPGGTCLSIDSVYRGCFLSRNRYHEGLEATIQSLRKRHMLAVISGDTDQEYKQLVKLFGSESTIAFGQSPHDKLDYVTKLRDKGRRVLMIGDGLNDSGALKAADVGIAASNQSAAFFPACDGIMDAFRLVYLHRYIDFARQSMTLIRISIAISFLYNIAGLSYAVTGQLSPIIAAILMPLSSITVVLFATLMTTFRARLTGVA
jgi:Cu+-exporting ATPase